MFQSAFVAWLLLDFAVKQVVVSLMWADQSIALWQGVFHLTFVRNSGAAFSLLQGAYWVFYLAMAALIGLVCWFWVQEKPKEWLPVIGTALVCAGAAGNLVDRLVSGSVVDIFDFRLINFAVFNVADIGITVGCGLFLFWFIFRSEYTRRRDSVSAASSEPDTGVTPLTASDKPASLTYDAESALTKQEALRLRFARIRTTWSTLTGKLQLLRPSRLAQKAEFGLARLEDKLSNEAHD